MNLEWNGRERRGELELWRWGLRHQGGKERGEIKGRIRTCTYSHVCM